MSSQKGDKEQGLNAGFGQALLKVLRRRLLLRKKITNDREARQKEVSNQRAGLRSGLPTALLLDGQYSIGERFRIAMGVDIFSVLVGGKRLFDCCRIENRNR